MSVDIYARQRAGWNTLAQAVRSKIIEDLRVQLKNNVESLQVGRHTLKPRSMESVLPSSTRTDSKYRLNQAYQKTKG